MPQVTAPPVNADNLQVLFFMHLLAYTFVLAHYSMVISSVQDQSINYEGNWYTATLPKWHCTRPGVIVLVWGIRSALNRF